MTMPPPPIFLLEKKNLIFGTSEKYLKCFTGLNFLLLSRLCLQTANSPDVLRAYVFVLVSFPMSNKCLWTVKCEGVATKNIPQNRSRIEELLGYKRAEKAVEVRFLAGGCKSSLVLLSGT